MDKKAVSVIMLASMFIIISAVSVEANVQIEASEQTITRLGDLIIDGDQTFEIENSTYTQTDDVIFDENLTSIMKQEGGDKKK